MTIQVVISGSWLERGDMRRTLPKIAGWYNARVEVEEAKGFTGSTFTATYHPATPRDHDQLLDYLTDLKTKVSGMNVTSMGPQRRTYGQGSVPLTGKQS